MTPTLGIWDYPLVEQVTIVALTTFIIGKLHAFYRIAMNYKLWTWYNTYYTLLNTIKKNYVNLTGINYSIWLRKGWVVLYNFNVFSVLPLTCKELSFLFRHTLMMNNPQTIHQAKNCYTCSYLPEAPESRNAYWRYIGAHLRYWFQVNHFTHDL